MRDRAASPGERAAHGARPGDDGHTTFAVWAPRPKKVELELVGPERRLVPLERDASGTWSARVAGAGAGTRYFFVVDGSRRPDPASRAQPEGVHGPSEVVDLAFPWTDAAWRGHRLGDLVIYELHAGCFTPEGTFEAAIARLDALRELGVTAIEVMPVAAFPGSRNWGYDGVGLFAAHTAYGGARGLQRLVDACHARGLGLVLDVVYNHLGPEGNYLGELGPYFTDEYRTPWGSALNFDGPDSEDVRRFFIENALQWVEDFHVDALRLDAVHAIRDHSAIGFLEDLRVAVHESAARRGRRVHLVAESDDNDARVVRSPELGGIGMDAQWSDDFHHAVHTVLTGERHGYYADFGRVADVAKALAEGFVRSGQYSPVRRRRHGSSSRAIPGERLVVCIQNHDQVGNRARGDRLSALVPFEALKVASGLLLLSPCVPLLFMGEEYGETNPFQYFVSHGDPALVEAVRKGRAAEFAFAGGDVPDPQDPGTFERSKLDWGKRDRGRHAALLAWYRRLLALRREPPFAELDKEALEVLAANERTKVLAVRRGRPGEPAAVLVARLGSGPGVPDRLPVTLPFPEGRFLLESDAADERWGGPGATAPAEIRSDGEARLELPPHAFVVYRRKASG